MVENSQNNNSMILETDPQESVDLSSILSQQAREGLFISEIASGRFKLEGSSQALRSVL